MGDPGPGGASVRLVIAEDSALFRAGLARLLEDAGHSVVAQAVDAPGAIESVLAHEPDVAVFDVRMPPGFTDDGARAALQVRAALPGMGIVLLSQRVEARRVGDLVAGGHFAYLLKDRVLDVDDFLDVLERVRAGGTALDPEVVIELLAAARADTRLARLTPRERDVLALMAEGRTNLGIARRLVLTERTVETHVSSILSKLGLPDGEGDHRRVLAVVAYLDSRPDTH